MTKSAVPRGYCVYCGDKPLGIPCTMARLYTLGEEWAKECSRKRKPLCAKMYSPKRKPK